MNVVPISELPNLQRQRIEELEQTVAMLEQQVHSYHNTQVEIISHVRSAIKHMRQGAELQFLSQRELELIDHLKPILALVQENTAVQVMTQTVIEGEGDD